jgi:hypothetical protein
MGAACQKWSFARTPRENLRTRQQSFIVSTPFWLSFHPGTAVAIRQKRFFTPATAVAPRNDGRFDRTRRWPAGKSAFIARTRSWLPETTVVLPGHGRDRPAKPLLSPSHGGGMPKRRSFCPETAGVQSEMLYLLMVASIPFFHPGVAGGLRQPAAAWERGVPPAGWPGVSPGDGTGSETPPAPAAGDGCATSEPVQGFNTQSPVSGNSHPGPLPQLSLAEGRNARRVFGKAGGGRAAERELSPLAALRQTLARRTCQPPLPVHGLRMGTIRTPGKAGEKPKGTDRGGKN